MIMTCGFHKEVTVVVQVYNKKIVLIVDRKCIFILMVKLKRIPSAGVGG